MCVIETFQSSHVLFTEVIHQSLFVYANPTILLLPENKFEHF